MGLLVIFLAAGCARAPIRMVDNTGRNRLYPVETGIASWYGREHAGRLTANGEKFNPRRMTAAHRTLPFNTIVRVTNLKNHRQVVVRINDRGPYVKGRIIDLSRRAARKLDMLEHGIVPARVEVMEYPAPRKKRQ
jgi:rare lipoprotein A